MKLIGHRLLLQVISYNFLFWLTIAIGLALITTSYPMMKLRYDLWEHVDKIRAMVLDDSISSHGKRYWYACWAFVFKLFSVTDISIIAIVIHRIQFILNCLLIYLTAKQLFTPLLSLNKRNTYQNQWLSSLALSSVFVWMVSIGTFSYIQQAWIMWYSVNYQITLTFLLLSISLMVNVLLVEQSKGIIFFKISISISLLILILIFHAGELAYFVFYLPIFIFCFANKLRMKAKYLVSGAALAIVILYLGIQFYSDQTPMLLTLIKKNDWSTMMALINEKGSWNVIEGGNRYTGNWNEMYRFNVYGLFGVAVLAWFNFIEINKKALSFIVLSLVFCFAPSYIFSSGFLSLVSYDGIVNRYYFASFLFLSIPLCLYFVMNKFEFIKNPINVIVATVSLVLVVFLYSKFINNKGVFYQNVKSIAVSIKAKKLDIEVSESDIANIHKQIEDIKKQNKNNDFLFCGPYKKIHVVSYLFNQKNVHFDRLRDISIQECEEHARKLNKYVVYIQ